ncbi:MAG: SRPBCC family protein, partial [Anaerolineales bacterium]|nr:SRPBCC family protein [Anaerolineales bacterium]
MPEFAVTTLIHRPVTELFAYFADPTRRAEWSDHVIAGRWLTPAPVGVGSIYEITTCQWGRTVKTRRRVTVFAPEREFTYEINSPLLYVLSRQQFEAAGDNTRYSVSGHGRLKGFARLV